MYEQALVCFIYRNFKELFLVLKTRNLIENIPLVDLSICKYTDPCLTYVK